MQAVARLAPGVCGRWQCYGIEILTCEVLPLWVDESELSSQIDACELLVGVEKPPHVLELGWELSVPGVRGPKAEPHTCSLSTQHTRPARG